MTASWTRNDDPAEAVDRILEGAEKAFSELGVSRAGMSEVADFAGCSRGTLYRYFHNRHALHVAYVERASAEIAAQVARRIERIGQPRERLVEGILHAVHEVRRRPGTRAWFEAGSSGAAARTSRASELVETIAGTFVARLLGSDRRAGGDRARARWLVRSILSLLANPADDEAEEREVVERFVVPPLLAESADARRAASPRPAPWRP